MKEECQTDEALQDRTGEQGGRGESCHRVTGLVDGLREGGRERGRGREGEGGRKAVTDLVDGLQGAVDGEVVLELNHDLLADQCPEERVEQLPSTRWGGGG